MTDHVHPKADRGEIRFYTTFQYFSSFCIARVSFERGYYREFKNIFPVFWTARIFRKMCEK